MFNRLVSLTAVVVVQMRATPLPEDVRLLLESNSLLLKEFHNCQ